MSAAVDAETLSLVRSLAYRQRCCADDADPCDRCLVLRAVDDLVLEVERHRAGLPPVPIRVVPSPEHEALASCARALVDALGHHTPMPAQAHVALAYVTELLEEIEGAGRSLIRQQPKPVEGEG